MVNEKLFNSNVEKGMKKMVVELIFIDEVLGSESPDPEIHSNFISSKAPDAKTREEEVEALGADEVEKKEKTIFYRNKDGKPCLKSYQIKGFLKAAGKAMNRIPGSEVKKIKAWTQILTTDVFIDEDWIPFEFEGEMGDCQRPLRATTQQGDRVALANSETIPAGAKIRFTITDLMGTNTAMICELLTYGKYQGLCQWRNSGKGRFIWRDVTPLK